MRLWHDGRGWGFTNSDRPSTSQWSLPCLNKVSNGQSGGAWTEMVPELFPAWRGASGVSLMMGEVKTHFEAMPGVAQSRVWISEAMYGGGRDAHRRGG